LCKYLVMYSSRSCKSKNVTLINDNTTDKQQITDSDDYKISNKPDGDDKPIATTPMETEKVFSQ